MGPLCNESLDLATLRQKNALRQLLWDPENKTDLAFRGLELGGEAGEALNAAKKLERERRRIAGSRTTLEELGKELADVVISADLMAMTAGIDLAMAVRKKFNEKSLQVGFDVFIDREGAA